MGDPFKIPKDIAVGEVHLPDGVEVTKPQHLLDAHERIDRLSKQVKAANEQLGALSARVQAVEGRLAAADADRRRLDVLANELDAVKRFLRDSSPSHTSGYLDEPPKLDEVLARRAQL